MCLIYIYYGVFHCLLGCCWVFFFYFFKRGVFGYSFVPWSVCAVKYVQGVDTPQITVLLSLRCEREWSLICSGDTSGCLPVICRRPPPKMGFIKRFSSLIDI